MQLNILDFYAPWCGPCMQIKKILPRLEEQIAGMATLTLVNIDEEKEKKARFKVTKVPTFIILNGDHEIERFEGVHPLATIGNAVVEQFTRLSQGYDRQEETNKEN